MKRWVAGGALALTGILSAVAAQVLPASHAKARTVSPATSAPASDQGSASSSSQSAAPSITPPDQIPQASVDSAVTVSGGS